MRLHGLDPVGNTDGAPRSERTLVDPFFILPLP